MGALYGKLRPSKQKAAEKVEYVESGKDIEIMRAVEDIQKFSEKDMLLEFENICAQNEYLENKLIVKNPCENAKQCVTQCLKLHTDDDKTECFCAMNEYRVCIFKQMKDKVKDMNEINDKDFKQPYNIFWRSSDES